MPNSGCLNVRRLSPRSSMGSGSYKEIFAGDTQHAVRTATSPIINLAYVLSQDGSFPDLQRPLSFWQRTHSLALVLDKPHWYQVLHLSLYLHVPLFVELSGISHIRHEDLHVGGIACHSSSCGVSYLPMPSTDSSTNRQQLDRQTGSRSEHLPSQWIHPSYQGP